jgi:hypothetical protein
MKKRINKITESYNYYNVNSRKIEGFYRKSLIIDIREVLIFNCRIKGNKKRYNWIFFIIQLNKSN